MLPPTSLSKIIYRELQFLKRKVGVGHILGNKKLVLLKEQGSVPN
jgi:hypothetical protein